MVISLNNLKPKDIEKIVLVIKQGSIVVLPTDTIYGIHASIFLPKTIERVYKLKGRKEEKPFIILINKIEDIKSLGINIKNGIKTFLKNVWPGKVSVIFPISNKKYSYLHKGSNTLAFRMPRDKFLAGIISKTGPLISTSVNPSRKMPAKDIIEAKKYFGNKVDLYIDDGDKKSSPSALIEIKDKKINILRQGSVKISNI